MHCFWKTIRLYSTGAKHVRDRLQLWGTWQTQRRSASPLTAGDGPVQRGKSCMARAGKRTAGSSFSLRDYWTCGVGELDLPHTGWKTELRINFQLWLPYTFKYTLKSQPQRKCALDSLVRHMVRRPPAFLKIESYRRKKKKKSQGEKKIISKNQGLTWEHFEDKMLLWILWFQSEWNLLKLPSPKIAETVMASKKKYR